MSLIGLAKRFSDKPLYIVGGYVRNMIAGVSVGDIDIASALPAEEVIERLKDSEYKVVPSSLRMGTLIIKDGKSRYEYTSFRTDSYPINSGCHSPLDVKFTDDIMLDAKRRDFTVNAIYYDILKEKIVDPLGGAEDVKSRVLRTTRNPEEVFAEDGLRLLRFVRFYAELGFRMSEHDYEVAKGLVHLLKDISIERITDEFNKILHADTKGYGNKDGHYNGLKKLIEMGAMEYIIPELLQGNGIRQNEKYHDLDVLGHILECVRVSDDSIRLHALMHDIGKPESLIRDGNMHKHNVIGSLMTKEILTRLRYPNKVRDNVAEVVYIHMFNLDNKAKDDTIRKFIVDYHDVLNEFLLLRKADILASKIKNYDSYYRIRDIYESMKRDNIPMSTGELAVNGNDLMNWGYKGKEIGDTLSKILYEVASGRLRNERETVRKQYEKKG